jgi:glycosyltransferase involved in cell wall biosynthesis
MKICLIGPSYPFRGGIAHYTTLLFKNLKKRHEVEFYSFKRQYPRFLFPGRTDKDYSNFILKDESARPIFDSLNPFSWLKVAFKIIKGNPDITIIPWWVIFWTPHFLTILFFLKMFSHTKILFVCHNVAEHEANIIKILLSKLVLSKGDYFIVHSTEEKINLIDLIGNKPIKETFHPTYEFFNIEEIPRNVAKEKLGVFDERIILFFGFVREYKGLKYLLGAMPEIVKNINVRLLIAGEFWSDKDTYLQLIKKLEIGSKVTIIDKYIPNEETPFYFYASDIVVLPYTSVTGSGLVQMAYGFNKPVIVTNIGALSEIVIDKKTGFLVAPRSSSEIAEAVLEFYRDSEGMMIENIKKENYRFSWDLIVEKIEDFIK